MHKYVRNILNTYSQASNIELQAGREWYDRAELLARTLCPNDVCRGAGVIAALSPRQTWDMNKKGAEKIIRSVDFHHSGIIPRVAGTYSNIQKAWDIANGSDPVKVLSSGTRPERWLKVQRFYRNITGNHYLVTCDTWAATVALGEFPTMQIGGRIYLEIESSYQQAARWVGGISPRDLQAVCWVHIRGSAE